MLAKNLPTLRRKLLRWYDHHRRDLPWRRSRDPYAIWISEVMLQQTQVQTVLPYYEKFLAAFPTAAALDCAPLEKVLRAWSGLGYYRRAENLKKAARQIMREHDGALPRDYLTLRKLAGVGDYTAGAILSIAFDQQFPAVDGNVRRVLSRLASINNEKRLKDLAAALVSATRPGDFNQALMELGASLCAPKEPRCKQCPLSSDCATHAMPGQRRRSQKNRAIKFTDVIWPLAIIRQRGKILLRRRALTGLMARLWELPGRELSGQTKPNRALRQELKQLSLAPPRQRLIGEIRHSITHRRIRAPIYLCEFPDSAAIKLPSKQWRWIDPRVIQRQAISSMTAKAVAALLDHEKSSL
ncbi:MAG TPA: A/G-specific adenine glycosylase [Candidatus Binatia bacterium]